MTKMPQKYQMTKKTFSIIKITQNDQNTHQTTKMIKKKYSWDHQKQPKYS